MENGIDIKLEKFEGPLELLLHLIEKNKVSIYDIPIVTITEQYIAYIDAMEREDMDVMSEFLVMAATLLNIKARMLLPKKEKEEEDYVDPRLELVNRLIEYKKYKYAAQELKDRQLMADKAFYRKESLPKEVLEYRPEIHPEEVVGDLDLSVLNRIFKEVMKRKVDKIDPVRSKFGKIEKEKISVEDKMNWIEERIDGLSGINFRTLLENQESKLEVVVTFLAVLELMKVGKIVIRQKELFDEIMIDSL